MTSTVFYSVKGGVGCSTLAALYAMATSSQSHPTELRIFAADRIEAQGFLGQPTGLVHPPGAASPDSNFVEVWDVGSGRQSGRNYVFDLGNRAGGQSVHCPCYLRPPGYLHDLRIPREHIPHILHRQSGIVGPLDHNDNLGLGEDLLRGTQVVEGGAQDQSRKAASVTLASSTIDEVR